MTLILVTMSIAVLGGVVAGGRISRLTRLRIRWLPAAVLGFGLQLIPVRGDAWPMAFLLGSFVVLAAFAVVNLRDRLPGFRLILVGLALNAAVIAVNGGMPVTSEALARSGQLDTMHALVDEAGTKHHLAGPGDSLLILSDAIPIAPLHEIVSLGDVFVYAGVAWLIVATTLARGPVGVRRSRSLRLAVDGAPHD